MTVPFELAYGVQQALNAAQIAAFYALLSASYALVYGVSRRINFAFGAIATFGAAAAFNVTVLTGFLWPVPAAAAVAVAAVYATGAASLLGATIERLVIRPVSGVPGLSMLVTTMALTIALEEAIRLANGSYERWLPPLFTTSVTIIEAPGFAVRLTASQILVVPIAALTAAGLVLLMRYHPFGRLWRACAEDPKMAALVGVDVAAVRAATFALASAAAGAAGVLMLIAYGNVNFHTSFLVAVKALLAAVAGGIGSVGGALMGGLLLAAAEVGWTATFDSNWRDVAVLLFLAVLFAVRPEGLFGVRERRDHAA